MGQQMLVGDYVTIRCWCTDTEQASVNTFHYKVLTTVGLGGSDTVAAPLVEALFAPLYKAIINNNAKWDGLTLQIHRVTADYAAVPATANAGSGTGGAVSLPRQVAGLTTWRTALAGRKYRGRTYWPFPPAAFDVGDGTPTVAAVTAMNAVATLASGIAFLGDDINYSTCQLVIRNKPVTLVPWTSNAVTNGITNTHWATIRRSGSYGRPNISPI